MPARRNRTCRRFPPLRLQKGPRMCVHLCIFKFACAQVERLRQILRDLIPEHLVARIVSAPGRQASSLRRARRTRAAAASAARLDDFAVAALRARSASARRGALSAPGWSALGSAAQPTALMFGPAPRLFSRLMRYLRTGRRRRVRVFLRVCTYRGRAGRDDPPCARRGASLSLGACLRPRSEAKAGPRARNR